MNMSDDESVFQDLVKRLGPLSEDDEDINLYDLTNTIGALGSLSSLLCEFICRHIDSNTELKIPGELIPIILTIFNESQGAIEGLEELFYELDKNEEDEDDDDDYADEDEG